MKKTNDMADEVVKQKCNNNYYAPIESTHLSHH